MFQSGFTANAGTVAAILSKDDVIVSDQLNHASIIDGARLSRAEIKVFPHKDVEAADSLLGETARPGRRQLLITDGVFSMDGDIAPLPDLVEVAERRGAIMMVDDAHASGVLGSGGAGTVDHFGLARTRRHPGGNAVEGDRGLGRVHRWATPSDRVAGEPWPAVPVLNQRPSGGRSRMLGRSRRDPRRARATGTVVVEHRDVQRGPAHARLRHRRIRDADHADHHRRRGAHTGVRKKVCSRRECSAPPSCSPPWAVVRRACERSSPRITPRAIWARRWRRSIRSVVTWGSCEPRL